MEMLELGSFFPESVGEELGLVGAGDSQGQGWTRQPVSKGLCPGGPSSSFRKLPAPSPPQLPPGKGCQTGKIKGRVKI